MKHHSRARLAILCIVGAGALMAYECGHPLVALALAPVGYLLDACCRRERTMPPRGFDCDERGLTGPA